MTQHNGTMRSVLIVDADPEVAAALAEILRPLGYAAQSAETPEQALAALRDADDAAPVALIDVSLGGTATGIDLIPRLRAEQPELICVLMTAELDSQSALAALRRGAYDYFEKSCDPRTVLSV